MAPGSVSGGRKGTHRCGIYPVSIDLYTYLLMAARRNLRSDQTKLCDRPPTGELIRSSVVPLTTTAAIAVTTYAAVAYKSPVATQ